MAEPGRLVLPARRDVLEQRRARPLRDAWQKAVYLAVPRAVLVQPVAPLSQQALLALLRAKADESDLLLLQAQVSCVRQALRQAAPLQVQELAPWVLVEQRPRALPVRLALPLAQREPPAHSVSPLLARRWLGALRQPQQASSARPSQPRPWLLFPL
jgi:hypothetical protein